MVRPSASLHHSLGPNAFFSFESVFRVEMWWWKLCCLLFKCISNETDFLIGQVWVNLKLLLLRWRFSSFPEPWQVSTNSIKTVALFGVEEAIKLLGFLQQSDTFVAVEMPELWDSFKEQLHSCPKCSNYLRSTTLLFYLNAAASVA